MREWKESENDKNGYFLLNISSNFQPRMILNVNEWRDSTVGGSTYYSESLWRFFRFLKNTDLIIFFQKTIYKMCIFETTIRRSLTALSSKKKDSWSDLGDSIEKKEKW